MTLRIRLMFFLVGVFFAIGIGTQAPAHAALWNKRYVIRPDQGKKILCDLYVVQENDWIYKIFRQKGEISERDFPTFLDIFKRLNPDIHDTDRIYPGSHILIPLKTITKDTLPTPPAPTVTIPFASISEQAAETVIIRKGDTISRLLAERFGAPGSKKYREGLRRYKILNPKSANPDRIFIGQKVLLPALSSGGPQGTLAGPPAPAQPDASAARQKNPSANPTAAALQIPSPPAVGATSLDQIALLLNAKLYDEGRYHFPQADGEDRFLDLSLFPVMRLEDQTRLLFIRPFARFASDIETIKNFWKQIRIVRIPAPPVSAYHLLDKIFLALNQNHPSREKISFTTGAIPVEIKTRWVYKTASPTPSGRYICLATVEKTAKPFPETIFNYLARHQIAYWEIRPDGKLAETVTRGQDNQYTEAPQTIVAIDPRHFVRRVATVLGGTFQDQVQVSFPYAGIQVDAVASMVSMGPNRSCLVDFGNFAGDSIAAIAASGLKIVSLAPDDNPLNVIEHLLDTLSIAYTIRPTLTVRRQKDGRGVFFTCPGILVNLADGQTLLTRAVVPQALRQYLETRGVETIRIIK